MNVALCGSLCAAAAWATYSDISTRRLPNALTFGAALVALALRTAFGGPAAALEGLEGWLLGLGILVVPYALGWTGAGDVKLLATFGAFGGPAFVIWSALLASVIGGLMAVCWLVAERRLSWTVSYLLTLARHPAGGAVECKRRMPFGPALGAGALLSMVLLGGLAG